MTNKIAYLYNEENIYIGTSNVFRDPLQSQLEQKEIFLLPNRATFVAPPLIADDEVVVFKDNAWVIKKNYFGKTIINKLNGETKLSESCLLPSDDWAIKEIDEKEELLNYVEKAKLCLKNGHTIFLNALIDFKNVKFSPNSLEDLKKLLDLGKSTIISRDKENNIFVLPREDISIICDKLDIYTQLSYIKKWRTEKLIETCQNIYGIKEILKNLDVSVTEQEMINVYNLSAEKREKYFVRMVSGIK